MLLLPTRKRNSTTVLLYIFLMSIPKIVSMKIIDGRVARIPHTGVMRNLVLRVTDKLGDQPKNNAKKISDLIFGTHELSLTNNRNSLASIYDQCSGGKITFVPATGPEVVDGILEIFVETNMTGMSLIPATRATQKTFNELNKNLDIEFEVYSIIMPSTIPGGGGLAQLGGDHQMYIGGAENSVELLVHEYGHNLGFHHSGIPNGSQYGDGSCMMGCCRGAQQMCFNAAKSWHSGWYSEQGKEGHEQRFLGSPGQFWKGNLVGVDDYLNGIFDETEHRVVLKIGWDLYMMFNRKKGINDGVKAYGDKVVLVQQYGGESGISRVLSNLDNATDSNTFVYSDYTAEGDDLVVKVCEIAIPSTLKGPQITGGFASQSSTSSGASANRAIDGNKDQLWSGGSVTHTEEENDPWWKWTLEQPKEVQSVVIYNRRDCCGNRLNNARVELYDPDGELLLTQNIGSQINIKELILREVLTVKEIKIKLFGNRVLSLAEVELFGRTPKSDNPDYANVITYVSGSGIEISCESTPEVTESPSVSPTVSSRPSIYTAIPKDVLLVRDNEPCTFETSWPRFRCSIKQTSVYNLPGTYDNDPVFISGKENCVIEIQPVVWAFNGRAFYFESLELLATVNACFAFDTHLTDLKYPSAEPSNSHSPSISPTISSQPSVYTAIPKDVKLWRDDKPCVYEKSWPRFKCTIKQTIVYDLPGTYGNDPIFIYGKDSCVIKIQPVIWAYFGSTFYFESLESPTAINACFASGTKLTDFKSSSAEPSNNSSPPSALPSSWPSMPPSNVPSFSPTKTPVGEPTKDGYTKCLKKAVKNHNKKIKKIQLKFIGKKEKCKKKTGSAKKKCLKNAKKKKQKQKNSAEKVLAQAIDDCDSAHEESSY